MGLDGGEAGLDAVARLGEEGDVVLRGLGLRAGLGEGLGGQSLFGGDGFGDLGLAGGCGGGVEVRTHPNRLRR